MYFINILTLCLSLLDTSAAGPVGSADPGSVIQAALQALKSVVTSPMSRQEKSRGAWKVVLRSALNTLLGLWNSGI